MAVTDLTGTTWTFNALSTNDFSIVGNDWHINFTSNSTNYSLLTQVFDEDFELGKIYYGSTNVFNVAYGDEDGVWDSEAYKTLAITGGTDVTNPDLLSWLQAHATQVQEDPSVELDLTTLHLSPGHYLIKAIAKASGFIDSAASTTVSYDVYGKCDTPITTIGADGYTFAFTAVAHATSYTLYVDNSVAQTGITTPPTSLDLRNLHLAAGAHTIQIKAIGSGYYNDSDLSTALTYTVYTITATLQNATANPSNVTKIDPGAVATLIYTFDGVSYECPTTGPVVTNATGTWTKNSTTQGTLVLSAANGNVSYTISGAEVMPQLDQVTNVSVTGTEATFDEVEHAESYEFFVDGNSIGEYTVQSGYTVQITDNRWDVPVAVYDGTDNTGVYLGTLEAISAFQYGMTATITSGNMYLEAQSGGYFASVDTPTGGVSITSGGTGSSYIVCSVTADGTITVYAHE